MVGPYPTWFRVSKGGGGQAPSHVRIFYKAGVGEENTLTNCLLALVGDISMDDSLAALRMRQVSAVHIFSYITVNECFAVIQGFPTDELTTRTSRHWDLEVRFYSSWKYMLERSTWASTIYKQAL